MWLTFAPVMAAVGDGKFDLDIPAADADIGLKHLSRQTGHSVIFQSVEVEDIQTNSLAGRYTIHVAIEVLLQGTILMGGLTESGVIAVSRKPTGKKEENLQMSIKNPGKSLFAGLVAIITTLTATPHVAGQENAGKSGSLTLEEIVVTAQKRTENLQKVPLAITAIGGEYLRFNDIGSFEELDKLVPGLLFSPYSDAQPEIAIRGIGTKEDGPAANDSTVVSIDDVYIAARIAQVMDIYDLERVEVLRGPQGTLYGRNSIGGSINLVTEKPSEQFKARLEQTYGRFDTLDTRGLITAPISSDNGLYGKISFSRRVHDGYIDSFNENLVKVDEIHERESISARGQLLWTPDDKFEATLTLDGAYNNHNGTNREPVNNSLNTNSIAAVNQARGFADSPYDSLADTYGFLDRKIWGGSLKMSYEFELATLTSITAYRRAYLDWQELCCGVTPAFISNSGMNMVDESTRQLTQELRLNGETDDKKWVLGLFLTDERDHRAESFDFPTLFIPPFVGIINNDCVITATENCVGTTDLSDARADIFAWAIYGQLTWDFNERLSTTLGLRYSFEEKDFVAAGSSTFGGGLIVDPFPRTETSDDWDSVDFRASIGYAFTDDILGYASASSGFKSGGFAGSPSTAAGAVKPFNREKALNYEGGIKSQWFDNTLQVNLTGFITDYKDLQVTRFATTPAVPVVGEFLTENAEKAELMGLEFELLWLLTENLAISGNYAYLDAEYKDFTGVTPTPAGIPLDFSGNVMRQAPEQTGGIDATLTLPLEFGGTVKARIGARYVDKIFYDPGALPAINRENSVSEAYTLMDARVAYTSESGLWELAGWVKNLTDEEHVTHVFTLGGGTRGFSRFGNPRWYGITLTLNYE